MAKIHPYNQYSSTTSSICAVQRNQHKRDTERPTTSQRTTPGYLVEMDPLMLLPETCFAHLSYTMLSPYQSHPNSLLHARTAWRLSTSKARSPVKISQICLPIAVLCALSCGKLFSIEPLHDLPSAIPSSCMYWSRDVIINEQLCRACLCFAIYIPIQKC